MNLAANCGILSHFKQKCYLPFTGMRIMYIFLHRTHITIHTSLKTFFDPNCQCSAYALTLPTFMPRLPWFIVLTGGDAGNFTSIFFKWECGNSAAWRWPSECCLPKSFATFPRLATSPVLVSFTDLGQMISEMIWIWLHIYLHHTHP